MDIRPASIEDFEELYSLGKDAPELRVSTVEEFMDTDEFKWSIRNPEGIFLLAEEQGRIVGFIYANAKDAERPFKHKYACLVYLIIAPAYRRQGLGQQLYLDCTKRLVQLGITHLYGWANVEGKGEMVSFLKKQGFQEGHQYKWMDKKIV
ncbi:GNAT family N-acetyltransferase [Candidatus Woesearchaeota archaeon]|nr:GNAT family N-acetyltransferase [Candidatus Woesearchaeota archaeon]